LEPAAIESSGRARGRIAIVRNRKPRCIVRTD
jgi:hypothetical protein